MGRRRDPNATRGAVTPSAILPQAPAFRSYPTFDSAPADTADEQRIARLRYLAQRVHRLGERPFYELLLELERGAELMPTLERYARLPGGFIRAHGGDRFAPFIVIKGDPDHGDEGRER